MRFLASLATIACIASGLGPLHASELAQGHHLWSVQAPNGVQSYIAATDFTQNKKVAALLHRQLENVPAVSRVMALGGRKDYSMPPDPRWKAKARDALPSDLLLMVETGLKPVVERVNQQQERAGLPKISAGDLPLEFIKILLFRSTDTPLHRKNEVLLTERIVNEFAASRGGKVTFLYSPPSEPAFIERIAKAQAKSDPVEIMRKLIRDRWTNASIGDRDSELFLQGDWKGKASLGDFGFATLLGIEESFISEIVSPEAAVELDAATDKVASALLEKPTLLLLTSSTSVLGEDRDLLSELQRRGFIIQPISLTDRRP